MTELKFYTDGNKVYLNNDKGITKEVDLSALTGGNFVIGVSVVDFKIVLDKHISEISEALSANKICFGVRTDGSITWLYLVTAIVGDSVVLFGNDDEGTFTVICEETGGGYPTQTT